MWRKVIELLVASLATVCRTVDDDLLAVHIWKKKTRTIHVTCVHMLSVRYARFCIMLGVFFFFHFLARFADVLSAVAVALCRFLLTNTSIADDSNDRIFICKYDACVRACVWLWAFSGPRTPSHIALPFGRFNDVCTSSLHRYRLSSDTLYLYTLSTSITIKAISRLCFGCCRCFRHLRAFVIVDETYARFEVMRMIGARVDRAN